MDGARTCCTDAQALGEVLAMLAQAPRPPLSPVEFKYSAQNPLTVPYTVDVPGCGLRFTVDQHTLQLVAADVRTGVPNVVIMHSNAVVGGATFQAVCERLGPAHAGHVAGRHYILPYTGAAHMPHGCASARRASS